LRRGEIRWYTFRPPDKRRPVLILTRNDVIEQLNEIIVAPATRTIRGLTTEIVLTMADGMPTACALNFDHVALANEAESVRLCATCLRHDGPKFGGPFFWRVASRNEKTVESTTRCGPTKTVFVINGSATTGQGGFVNPTPF
jgi:mRNA interferase MazF